MPDWCLITDIDGTLIGETETSKALRDAVLAERDALARDGSQLRWVIATGRSRESAVEILLDQGFELDDFDVLITSVGAEMFIALEERMDEGYHAFLGQSGFVREEVEAVLAELTFLETQPTWEQLAYKVSYVVPDLPEHRARVQEALSQLKFPTQTVFSHDSYLDVAPHVGAKGGAVAHLLSRWNLAPSRAVAAGDSGNDRSMLDREWHGIVVGNGHGVLDDLRGRSSVYFARRPYAAGVLEGLHSLGFLRG